MIAFISVFVAAKIGILFECSKYFSPLNRRIVCRVNIILSRKRRNSFPGQKTVCAVMKKEAYTLTFTMTFFRPSGVTPGACPS